MATMTMCVIDDRLIDIDMAVDIKDENRIYSPDFRCTECNQPVRPHRSGGRVAAHFEHLERNPACSQSHVAR